MQHRTTPLGWAAAALAAVHALIHLLGVAEGFGLTDVDQFAGDVPPGLGVLWLAAALALAATAAAMVLRPRVWWAVGIPAVALSQVAIATAWADAAAGTAANVVLLLAALHSLAAEGPWSLRARYRRMAASRAAEPIAGPGGGGHGLARLPAPVRRYLEWAGVADGPPVARFRARMEGRIRMAAGTPWMAFTAEQVNTVDPPQRLFLMKARRGGLPVDVLHVFADGAASLEARLLSLARVASADGPEMTRAETVTLLNDLCVLAPGALAHPSISWEPIDDRTARASLTVGPNTVSAVVSFDGDGALRDFVSDDRLRIEEDGSFARRRWSTPLSRPGEVGGIRLSTRGEARWHGDGPDGGDGFAYVEMQITGVEADPIG